MDSTWPSRRSGLIPATDYTLRNTPKVVGGITPACTENAPPNSTACLRRGGTGLDARSGRADQTAWEYLPLAQHRASQREAIRAERMAVDIWEVVDAASTKPYGFMRFEPGPGMGGHLCRSIRST